MKTHGLVLLLALATVPTAAHADWRDVGIGALGTWEITQGGRGGVATEFGLSDATALRGEVTYGRLHNTHATQVLIGPTLVWDVFAWVPAFTLAAGIQVEHNVAALGLARVEIRHYVLRSLWVSAGAGVELQPDDVQGQVLVSVFWQL